VDFQETLAAFDRERRELEVSDYRRVATPELVRYVPIDPGVSAMSAAGFVSFSRHSPTEIEAAINDLIAAFSALRCKFEWKVFEHDLPSDLVSRLQRRGLDIGEAEELVVLPLAAAASLLGAAIVHRVERVTSPEQLLDYLAVTGEVWREKEHAEWVKQQLREHPDEIALYVAYVGDRPAASARASFSSASRFAGLWTGATLPEYRRRGLYTELVRARAREAAARGYDYLMVDALPTSRPTLTRLGFQRLSASRPCRWAPDQ
jgi:GNAT superfamily N-acetyltransferase